MEELVKRINEVKDYYRLSGRALAIKLDMKYTTINNYLNGTKDPSAEFLVRLKSTFLDISADWLLVGEGSMLKDKNLSNEEITKELADAKVKMLIKDGIIKELKDLILEKNNGELPIKDEIVKEKHEVLVG